MSTVVVMPQMGESVAEGTIVRWIKQVGESIEKDEPLFEISTDKVDAEIPSPDGGVLLEIRVKEGETVPVNTVVAIIGRADDVTPHHDEVPAAEREDIGASPATARAPERVDEPGGQARERWSPAVRKLARERGVDLHEVTGTGAGGRVTRQDLDRLLAPHGGPEPAAARPATEGVRTEKLSVIRKKIAEHMVESVRTSPHVYSAYEVDFGRIDGIRRAKKAAYEADGVRLTYTAFIAKATVDTLRDFPLVNASLDGDTVIYKDDINLGIAVALEQGLIVPVVHAAHRLDFAGLSRAIQDLAHRARTKQLKPEDVQGGTFTVTNPGMFGGLFGLPIINRPQAAILAVGSVDKRAVVIDDAIVIRPMCYLTLGYDHRLVDGADGGRFLQALKERLQNFDDASI